MKILAYFVVLCTCLATSSAIPGDNYLFNLYMNENCGNMDYTVVPGAVLLKYKLGSGEFSCKMGLEAASADEMFIVKAIKVNFEVDDCSNTYVSIEDVGKFCGTVVPPSSFVVSDSWLTIDYEAYDDWNSFQLLITKFTYGDCNEQGKFTCDNDRCIARSLTCDGWDNCGDNSDEEHGCHEISFATPGLIAGITIGTAVLVILFVTLVVLRARNRRMRRIPVEPQQQPILYGSITPNLPGYTPVLPPAYEKINHGHGATGTGNTVTATRTGNTVTPSNPSVNP